jgi:hypothetical protein
MRFLIIKYDDGPLVQEGDQSVLDPNSANCKLKNQTEFFPKFLLNILI